MTARSSVKWFVATVVLAVVIVSSVAWLRRNRTETAGAFASAKGQVETIEHEVTTKRASRITKVLVREGDTVEPGQIIAEMESLELREEKRQAEAALKHAREELHQAEPIVAQKKSDVEQVMASLERQEREFVLAQDHFERSRELLARDLIARQELSEIEGKLRIAEVARDLERARRQAAEAALKAAEFQVKQKQAAIHAAQARTQGTRSQTEDRFLRAPRRGIVLARHAEAGEGLLAGGKVLTLLERNGVYMTIPLPRAQAERVGLGSEARVVLDAIPHKVFPGLVAFIAPDSPLGTVETKGLKQGASPMFRVKINIETELLRQHWQRVETGLTGVAYVRLDSATSWPASLQMK